MENSIKVDFNKPCLAGKELVYIAQAVNNAHISGDGFFTRKCHAILEQLLNSPRVLLTTSCTHALEMAALLLGIRPGDEVIIPSFTFVSTINAFVLRGAHPVFIDIHPDTLNLDESQLERLITPHTKAIVPVHYAGIGCEMDTILDIANQHRIAVVEDNAHGLFGKYKGRFLGTFGCLATQSFHETKNITCGEGGALVINDPQYCDKAEIIREKGTDRSRFFRGQVDKYTWVDIGSSYLPSEILAAFLYAQLEKWQDIQTRRLHIWQYYNQGLTDWAVKNGIGLPVVPPYCEQPGHMYYMRLPSLEHRQNMIAHLKNQGINSVFHYLPLHLSEMGQKFGGCHGDCPVTEKVSDQLIRMPFYNSLTDDDLNMVIQAVFNYKLS